MSWFSAFHSPPLPRRPRKNDRLGVQVLTEFVFCHRAGLIALANTTDDRGTDLPEVRDYFPRYDLRRLQEALRSTLHRVWLTLAALGAMLAITVGAAWVSLTGGIIFGAAICLALAIYLVRTIGRALTILDCLRAARQAVPIEPTLPLTAVEDVRWWDLLQAGYVSREFDQPLEVTELSLIGKPWRVLCKGSVRIPVFLPRQPTDHLHEQHFVRIAAYGQLIEIRTGLQVPYGIVLRGDSYTGWAIPHSAASRPLVERAIAQARVIIRRDQNRLEIEPRPESYCRQCRLAAPVKPGPQTITYGRDGQPLPMMLFGEQFGPKLHAPCGDRFQWIPPHRTTVLRQWMAVYDSLRKFGRRRRS